jgi:hypothetical protein
MGFNEPQVWTLIGVFGTAMFGLVALVLTSIRSQFASLRSEIATEFRSFRSEVTVELRSARGDSKNDIASLRTEMTAGFAVVGSRIDSLDMRLDHLDRDVQLLMNREFGENRS